MDLPPPPPTGPAPPGHATKRGRQWKLLALIAIVAVVGSAVAAAVLVTSHGKQATTTSVSLAGVTSEDQLDELIRTQGLTPQRALAKFSLDVGSLPGVSVSGIKSSHGFDGTPATLDLYAEWSGLTAAQQDAAIRWLDPPSAVQTASRFSAARGGPRGGVLEDSYDYKMLAEQASLEEATESGAPPFTDFVFTYSDTPFAYAVATLYYKSGNGPWQAYSDGCHIEVSLPLFESVDSVTAAALMAHEVWHCYEQRQAGSGAAAVSLHLWIGEGESTWVMDQLFPTNSYTPNIWLYYASTPTKVFASRSYDAVGVFGHQGDVAGGQASIWPDLLPVVSAGVGGQDSAALKRLMGSASDRFYSSWGASYFEDQTHIDWHMAGPGGPPKSPAASPAPLFMTNGDAQEIGIEGAYQGHETTIDGNADILIITLASGYGKAHDNGYMVEQTLDTAAPLSLCMRKLGCKCPDGSEGASLHTIPAVWPVSTGLNGGDMTLAAYARGDSLARYCQKPDQGAPSISGPGGPPSGGEEGSGGGEPPQPNPSGMAWGDPHYATFDGRRYDMQVAGEFTLVKSTVDDFEVQTRTVPIPGSLSAVAVNAAVAVRLTGHRVTFTLENDVIVARIDGVVDDYVEQNAGQGTVMRLGTEVGDGFVVEWPDGSTVRVVGSNPMNVTVELAADRAGKVTGLLGTDNGGSSAGFVTSDGVSLGEAPTAQVLDGRYADSWRITQAESLFDYAPGQSTTTFTNRAFPASYVDSKSVAGAAAAKQRCEADGITDPYLLADCTVDAASTPGQSVLTTYAQAQVVQTVQYNLAHNLPAFAPAASENGGGGALPTPSSTPNLQGVLLDIGQVNNAAETQSFSFPGTAGEIIWIGLPGCDDGGLTFALVDPNGATLNSAAIAQQDPACSVGLGRVVLPLTGTYQLVANVDHKSAASYSLPIRVERPDVVRMISVGETVSGSIPDTAAQDMYTFSAQAGEIITIGGPGCTAGPTGSPLFVSSVHDIPAQNGVPPQMDSRPLACGDSFQLQLTDTYNITVNPENVGPFSYQFTIEPGQQ